MPLDLGSRLAHYDITVLIGEGKVCRARHTQLERTLFRDVEPQNIVKTRRTS